MEVNFSHMHPEGILLQSIFYRISRNNYTTIGDIAAALFSERMSYYGFQNIPLYIQSRLTFPLVLTCTNPR